MTGPLRYTIVPYDQLPPPKPVLYSSKEHGNPGNGWPSSCNDLARLPRNINDANNYYITIGLWPWADQKTIRRTCRRLLARYHPDGAYPHLGMFERVEEIYRILTDPVLQQIYHSVPAGARYIDRFVKKELFDEAQRTGKPVTDFAMPEPEGTPDYQRPEEPSDDYDDADDYDDDIIDADPEEADPSMQAIDADSTGHWDYMAEVPVTESDQQLAQIWYGMVLESARLFGYKGPIKVVLTNGEKGWVNRAHLLRIPRDLAPTKKNSRELFIWSR